MTGRLYHPLRLTAAARPMVFGGHAIAQHLGRSGLPDWAIGETWEVSDVDGAVALSLLLVAVAVAVIAAGRSRLAEGLS